MAALRKLDFVIAGAQKAGTTALFHYLDQNPHIYMPAKKELHAFNRPLDWSWERRRLPDAKIAAFLAEALPEQVCGEGTPAYLYWQDAFALMAEHNPAMRIVLGLRHPVMRAFSAWRMEHSRGRETLSFSDAIRSGRDRVARSPGAQHKIYSYVERGFYAAQIEALLSVFPGSQLRILRLRDIHADSEAMQDLQRFLGVAPVALVPVTRNVSTQSAVAPPPPGLADDFAYLQSLYAADMARLPGLAGLDIADWLEGPPRPTQLDWTYATG